MFFFSAISLLKNTVFNIDTVSFLCRQVNQYILSNMYTHTIDTHTTIFRRHFNYLFLKIRR